MTRLRNRLIPPLSALLTSRRRRDLARNFHALRRRLSGAPPTVRYFHQVDDPYSHLAAQMRAPLMARYAVTVEVYLVPPTFADLADESWRGPAEANRKALLEAGLCGAPTYRVSGKPAHWGQDRLWALEEDIP